MTTALRAYVASLGLDAWVVGGAVRDELLGLEPADEDFLVDGVDQDALRVALAPFGRVEDLEVHGEVVGVRLHPRDRAVRALAPAGIELTPPRTDGTGGAEDALVADLSHRDLTVNAMARHLATGRLLDPFGGAADLARGALRLVSPGALEADPLRVLRVLRLVSQLGLAPTADTVARMRVASPRLAQVAPERVGGGLAADGTGELTRLLLGSRPAAALRLGRDCGALAAVLPELGPLFGLRLDDPRQPLSVDEHLFAVVQGAADSGLAVHLRLAGLMHDVGKAEPGETGCAHAVAGARIAVAALRRLRYPARLAAVVGRIVRDHSFAVPDEPDPAAARRFLARHGLDHAFDLLRFRRLDLAAKAVAAAELERCEQFARLVEAERGSAHRLCDLAVRGDDLVRAGFAEGPEIGRVLRVLLDEVVDDPSRNDRASLLARAAEELVR